MTPYQYRKSHCGDKTILRPSYLHNGISYIFILNQGPGGKIAIYPNAIIVYHLVIQNSETSGFLVICRSSYLQNTFVGWWSVRWAQVFRKGRQSTRLGSRGSNLNCSRSVKMVLPGELKSLQIVACANLCLSATNFSIVKWICCSDLRVLCAEFLNWLTTEK